MTVRAAVLGRRACAVLAGSSAALHGLSLSHVTNVFVLLVTVVMLVACLACARDLWVRGTMRTWALLALMNLAMVAIHLGTPVHHSATMGLATGLAVVEAVAAAAVLVRHRALLTWRNR